MVPGMPTGPMIGDDVSSVVAAYCRSWVVRCSVCTSGVGCGPMRVMCVCVGSRWMWCVYCMWRAMRGGCRGGCVVVCVLGEYSASCCSRAALSRRAMGTFWLGVCSRCTLVWESHVAMCSVGRVMVCSGGVVGVGDIS